MSGELTQADKDAMLLVEAYVLGQQNPALWENYMNGWMQDVQRRINEKFGVAGSVEPIGPTDSGAGAS